MMHKPFNGSSVEIHPREWNQSPETFQDMPQLSDAHGRTLRDLVHSVQMPLEESKAEMMKSVKADSQTGNQVQYYFSILDEMKVMDFAPHEFNDQATFLQWLELSKPAFMHLGQYTPKTGKKSASNRLCKDVMAQLSKWMKIHNVNASAVHHFDGFRKMLPVLLGRDAAPSTKTRKNNELKFTTELRQQVKARLEDLLNNPNAVPLVHESKKKGQDDIIGKGRLLSIQAAFFIGLNTTNRGGEIAKLQVGDIDFANMTISTYTSKVSSGTFGEVREDPLWPETAEVVKEYIQSRRTEKMRAPDADLFGKGMPACWRSLMKDILGDQWTTGLGLHKLSRNGGVQALMGKNGSMAHITAAASFSPTTANQYIQGFNSTKVKAEADEMKRDAYAEEGLLGDALQATQTALDHQDDLADLEDLKGMLSWLRADAAIEASMMTGEKHNPSEMPVALFNIQRGANGELVSIPMSEEAPRERFELPSVTLKLLTLLEAEAKAALADASEMNMKTAMDLLKTLAGGVE